MKILVIDMTAVLLVVFVSISYSCRISLAIINGRQHRASACSTTALQDE